MACLNGMAMVPEKEHSHWITGITETRLAREHICTWPCFALPCSPKESRKHKDASAAAADLSSPNKALKQIAQQHDLYTA